MSQRLEIVRARDDPAELRDMAAEAVRWWVGAPAHAHAVAAGFHARAGDLDAARRELDTVLALDDWRTDRSYLWSIFIGELIDRRDRAATTARCASGSSTTCCRSPTPARSTAPSSASWAPTPTASGCSTPPSASPSRPGSGCTRRWRPTGGSAPGPGRPRPTAHWPPSAARRLPSTPGGPTAGDDWPAPTAGDDAGDAAARLRRVGDMWQASYRGHTAYIRDTKGLHDLAALLARPGTDLPALSLAGGELSDRAHRVPAAADPVLDRTALLAYRRRLAELDEELAAAGPTPTWPAGRAPPTNANNSWPNCAGPPDPTAPPASLANTAAERARKAVTARIRDAIRRITDAHPELGAHLDRTIRTGTTCRYEPRTGGACAYVR